MSKLIYDEKTLTKIAIKAANNFAERFNDLYPGKNPFQPGIVKEMIVAEALGHKIITDKHQPDAINDDGEYCEYLCRIDCKNPTFCFDGMASRPEEQKRRSLERISRNNGGVFCAIFDPLQHTKIKRMYKVEAKKVKEWVDENLTKRDKNGTSKNNEHTISIPEKWVKTNGVEIEIR